MKDGNKYFGIYLGLSKSSIACYNGIDVKIIKNNEGFEFTPSAVWMDSREILHVGRRAKEQLKNDPENAFSEFIWKMGTKALYTFKRNGKIMSPQELSAEVLKSLKDDVSRQLGKEVTSVVITVPASFELPQCQATNKAAELAGFINHPLLQEPIAAAMAYGFQSEPNNKFWMVYDFGEGTFNASIIQIKDGQIEVVIHGGDNGLGGEDLDWEIVSSLLVPAVAKENNIKNFTRNNKQFRGAFAQLKAAAEKAKIRLSIEDSIEIYIENLFKNDKGEAVKFTYELLKSDFERLVKPFIIRSINICKKILHERNHKTSGVDKIIMVGETSQILFLQQLLNEEFRIPLEISIDPTTVYVKGATVFANSQLFPLNTNIEIQQDEFRLELDYQPVGPDSELTIGGRVLSDKLKNLNGFTIEFVNKTARPEWRSGKVGLNSEGGFITQLWAEKGKKNEFLIELYNQTGARQKTIPDKLTYTMCIDSTEAPLIHSLGNAMPNNETDFLLVKGIPLPAKSRTIYRTTKDFIVGQKEDFINLKLYEGEDKFNNENNRLIGSLNILASKIKKKLSAGSEIEITLVIDTSRLISVKAYIPKLDEEFEVNITFIVPESTNKQNIMTTTESTPKNDCEILIQAATPDIYRINAFRISGLNINATTREISNQVQKNQMMEKYSGKMDNHKSPFPIEPPPDIDKLRQALHRLRDPETRIIDEFFWFWPHSLDDTIKDNALESLSRNDIKTAESLWINYEATLTESNVSRHNLAVLSHLLVLDIELNGNSLAKEETAKRDKYWKDTFKRWTLLIEHEGFWSRLTARVRQMDDPRLTTGFVKRLRESLPYAIIQINASLALKAAEVGNKSEASRQIGLMNDSGFGKDVVLAVLKHITKPLRSRIKIICKSFSDEKYPDTKSELIACKKILEQTMPILNTIHALLPKENTIKEGAYDEVALTGTSMAISYANATKDWESVIPIFEELRKIVIGESAKNRVEDNYEIFKRNIVFDQLYNTCFFCNQNKADEKATIEKKMYGNVREVWENYQNLIRWDYITIQVPRCEKCKKEHNKQDTIITLGVMASIAAGLTAGGYLDNLYSLFWIGFIVGGIGIIASITIGINSRKTKSKGTFDQFPQIKELIKEGWTWGEKPNTD